MRIVVKIGGRALEDADILNRCAVAIAQLAQAGHEVAVVHGGGASLTRVLGQLGKESSFVNGLRVTDSETRDVALMVLAGTMNKKLVAAIASKGQPAVGLSGGDGQTFRARKKHVNDADLGFVGEIVSVNRKWLEAIWQMQCVPVISSIALGYDGEYYNVNADETASACAVGCGAHALIFLTDVPGVRGSDGTVIRWLHLDEIPELEKSATISGGMLPKLGACKKALAKGVHRVRIFPAMEASVLPDFYFRSIDYGTEVVA